MNTLDFQNIFALLDINTFFQIVKLYQYTRDIFFLNITEIENPQSVNSDDFTDSAP
jgi:hypothetical protein